MNKFSCFLAKRYLFSKSSNNAINIITGIAALGILIGSLSLFIVLSGFAGLKDFSLQFTNYFDSDYEITPKEGKTFILDANQIKAIEEAEIIDTYSKVIEERVFLHFNGKSHIAHLKGVDGAYENVIQTDSILYTGEWFKQNLLEVVIGTGTSSKLSLGMYDYNNLLEIYTPKPGQGQILEPSQAFNKTATLVSGIYFVTDDVNSKYVFAPFDLAKNLLQLKDNEVYALEIKATTKAKEKDIRNLLYEIFGEQVRIKNRMQQNDALYKMLNTENMAVYLIFTLVLIIALFNLIGSIIMMILDKRQDIQTLYNIGADIPAIRKAFFLQGMLMTSLGGLFGVLLGLIVVFIQQKWPFVYITPHLAYPVKLQVENVFIVLATIIGLGIIASKIASTRVKESLIKL